MKFVSLRINNRAIGRNCVKRFPVRGLLRKTSTKMFVMLEPGVGRTQNFKSTTE